MKVSLDELAVFLSVVDTGSLTAAADRLEQPVSTTSRLLARLEDKLQVTLLRRTTRRLDLTDEGCGFVEDARVILESVRVAEERLMHRRGRLSGPLYVDASTPFMLHVLVPLMRGYRDLHPEVELNLSTEEGFIDLLERRVDVAFRVGELKDSTLHRRLLGHTTVRLFASPDYLHRRGVPRQAKDLADHELLGFMKPDSLNIWPLREAATSKIDPTVFSSSGETLRQLALQGMGIVHLSEFMTAADVAAGHLVEVLQDVTLPIRKPVNAVYYKHSAVSARIASMVDFVAAAMTLPETAWASSGDTSPASPASPA